MPLWLQIVFLAAAIPTVLVGLFLFGGGFKSQDHTKGDGSSSFGGGDGGGFDSLGGDCGGGGGD
jgi:uncharacterized membrane protein YgcG